MITSLEKRHYLSTVITSVNKNLLLVTQSILNWRATTQFLNFTIHLKILGNWVAYNKCWDEAGRALKGLSGEEKIINY